MESITIFGDAITTVVVSLELAKANANIEYSHVDDLLNLYLDAAIQDAENYTGQHINPKNCTIEFKEWEDFLILKTNPFTVTAITYIDADGETVTMPDTDYKFITDQQNTSQDVQLLVDEYPELHADTDYPITITGTVGYTAATIPTAIQSAILLKFAHKEMFREDAPKTGADRSFNAALRPYRIR